MWTQNEFVSVATIERIYFVLFKETWSEFFELRHKCSNLHSARFFLQPIVFQIKLRSKLFDFNLSRD